MEARASTHSPLTSSSSSSMRQMEARASTHSPLTSSSSSSMRQHRPSGVAGHARPWPRGRGCAQQPRNPRARTHPWVWLATRALWPRGPVAWWLDGWEAPGFLHVLPPTAPSQAAAAVPCVSTGVPQHSPLSSCPPPFCRSPLPPST